MEEKKEHSEAKKLFKYDLATQFLDASDIKKAFKVSDKTIYRRRKDKVLKFVKFGGKYIYPRKNIEQAFKIPKEK